MGDLVRQQTRWTRQAFTAAATFTRPAPNADPTLSALLEETAGDRYERRVKDMLPQELAAEIGRVGQDLARLGTVNREAQRRASAPQATDADRTLARKAAAAVEAVPISDLAEAEALFAQVRPLRRAIETRFAELGGRTVAPVPLRAA